MIEKQYTLSRTGFVRPSTILVNVSNKCVSTIILEYREHCVELKNTPESLMDAMSLGIRPDTQFTIKAKGIDEFIAIQTIENRFRKINLIN
ncbi:HPr family phosphocarrier protein [Metabacillus endolithicus]|uniref:HPr family phosphocarrier protein n=1 Tax=Metabacillus endolithicus TaxID=1535204 RepID=A0ABW5BSA4_9BACI|nr:HPr family phosphocarrier protein [Metabacillus endolithicus]UPG63608.1 HPr family phosphocarrier protein [Metabacillus endolithicus]